MTRGVAGGREVRTDAHAAALAEIGKELQHFGLQFHGGAPVPGTALERAFRTAQDAAVAESEAGRSGLRQIADEFSRLSDHYVERANGNKGDWRHTWVEHCRQRVSDIDAVIGGESSGRSE